MNQINKKYLRGYTEYPLFFKVSLVLGVVIVALVFFYYTQEVIGGLKKNSTQVVTAYARLWQLVAMESTTGEEVNLIFEEVIQKSRFPIVVTDFEGNPQAWREVGIAWDDTTYKSKERLKKRVQQMDKEKEPIPIFYGEDKKQALYLHYADPRLIRQLRFLPLIEIGVLVILGLIGFITFSNIKKAEQHSIWVGMSKETAHQLGTPISSILGWLEILKSKSDPQTKETIEKMEKDVENLEKIAHRFSQIGSVPELRSVDLNSVVSDVVNYFKVRLPHNGLGVVIKENLGELEPVEVNSELLSWVLENLLKNSLEAVEPKFGIIEVNTKMDKGKKKAIIEVTDNGKGILPKEQKKIFTPGYTTKKRGWGLGLSLAKRIVEDYHSGLIYLGKSIPNVKTTFFVVLPIKVKG